MATDALRWSPSRAGSTVADFLPERYSSGEFGRALSLGRRAGLGGGRPAEG